MKNVNYLVALFISSMMGFSSCNNARFMEIEPCNNLLS